MRLDGSGPGVSSNGGVSLAATDAPPGPVLYRRRTISVLAEQFIPSRKPWPADVTKPDTLPWHTVQTPSGPIRVDPGDWIVTYADGLRIRITADLFPKMYEPAEGKET